MEANEIKKIESGNKHKKLLVDRLYRIHKGFRSKAKLSGEKERE